MPFRSSTATTNSIRLKRQCHRGCFLVVEGQDDQRFFSKFINPESCQITVANGKEYVIEVVHSLETECFSGIVGIVDADLDHIEGIRQSSNNLITLETVDLEALMIRSEALDSLLSEWASADKMAALGKDIREILIKIAAWTGCLRLYSYRNEYSLKFTKLKYAKCIDRVSLTVNIDDLVQEVLNLSQRPDLSTSDIVKEIKLIHQSIVDDWLICYGKDMVEILAFVLKRSIGSGNTKKIEMIKSSLRMSYHREDLNKSKLSQDLNNRESRNSPFQILKLV